MIYLMKNVCLSVFILAFHALLVIYSLSDSTYFLSIHRFTYSAIIGCLDVTLQQAAFC